MPQKTPDQIAEVLTQKNKAITSYLQVIVQLEKMVEAASIKLQMTQSLVEAYRDFGSICLECDEFLLGRWCCRQLEKLSQENESKNLRERLQQREQELQEQLQAPAIVKNQRCPLGLGTCIDHWNAAIRKAPQDIKLYYQRGLAYSRHGEFTKALADFSKVLKIDKKNAQAYYKRGQAYYHLQEYQKSIDDYNQAIKLRGKYAHAYNARGIIHSIRNNSLAAARDFEDATRFDPNLAEAFLNRAAEVSDMLMRQRLFSTANLLFLHAAIQKKQNISANGRFLLNKQAAIMKRYQGFMKGNSNQFDPEKIKKLLELFGGK